MAKINYPLEQPHPTGPEGWMTWALALRDQVRKLLEAGGDLMASTAVEDPKDWDNIQAWRAAEVEANKALEEV